MDEATVKRLFSLLRSFVCIFGRNFSFPGFIKMNAVHEHNKIKYDQNGNRND